MPAATGHASPSRISRRSAKRASKSRPAWTPRRWTSSRLAPTTYWPSRSVSSAITSTVDADRADRAAACAEGLADLLGLGRPEVLAEPGSSFISFRRSSPRTSASTSLSPATTGIAFAVARGIDAEKLRDRLDRPLAQRLHLLRLLELLGEVSGCGGRPTRDLEIGRVVAVLADDERVLARAGRREEVLAAAAAHDPGLGGDLDTPRSRSARRSACTRPSACGSSPRGRRSRGRTSRRPS